MWTPTGQRTFAALEEGIRRLGHLLIARGLVPGDCVLLLCGNRPEYVEAALAAERTGLSIVPVVYDLKPGELRHIFTESGAKACILDVALDHSLGALPDLLDGCRLRLSVGGEYPGFDRYKAALAAAPSGPLPPRGNGFPVHFTSGTTGRPKGVVKRLGPATPLARLLPELYGFRDAGDRYLFPIPLFHSGVFSMAVAMPLVAGATVYLLPKPDPVAVLQAIQEHRITHAYLTTYLFHQMREMTDWPFDTSSLRCILHGGAPCPVGLKSWAIATFGPIVNEYYGGTEGGGICISADEWRRKPGSVGRPIADLDVRILDDEGRPCPTGTPGFVYFRSTPETRFAYLNDPIKTAAAHRGDHFTLRDIGYLDDEGYLFLVGRDAEIVNSTGYNVYPEEVDQVLAGHPDVAQAVTFAIPVAGKGEALAALCIMRDPRRPHDEVCRSLFAHCRANLAEYKRPVGFKFTDSIPVSVTGKKNRLQAGRLYQAMG